MRVLVVGAGALGGYFGGRLLEAGRDKTFLVRPWRAEEIARHGLRIESAHGDAHLRPRTALAGGDLGGPYDLVLLAVKAHALDGAMRPRSDPRRRSCRCSTACATSTRWPRASAAGASSAAWPASRRP